MTNLRRRVRILILIVGTVLGTMSMSSEWWIIPNHAMTRGYLTDTALGSIHAKSPSSSKKADVSCEMINTQAYNDVNSPPAPPGFAVAAGSCFGTEDGYTCIACSTSGSSITVNDDNVVHGYIKLTDVNCGSGAPFSSGTIGTCTSGACTNTAPYKCTTKMSVYQQQSGPG